MNQRHHLKTFSFRVALTLLVMMLTMTAQTALAETINGVSYIDANGVTQTADNVTVLTGSETSLQPGWYVVNSTINYTNDNASANVDEDGFILGALMMNVSNGEYHIILADGGQMNIGSSTSPINCWGLYASAASITIYGQTNGTGALNVYTSGFGGDAIIADYLTINGGRITVAASGADASGLRSCNGDITINGGVVNTTATGTGDSFGIKAYGRFIFNGGQVTATGSNKGIFSLYNESGAISLSWKNTTDYIETNSYSLPYSNSKATLTIAQGKTFTDGNGHYFAAGNAADVLALTNTRLSAVVSYAVTFDSNGGSDVATQFVASGGTVTEPTPPTKAGQVFSGWYLDSQLQNPYSFTSAVTGPLTLYAKWADAISYNISDAIIQRIYRYTGSAVTPVVRNSAAQLLTAGTDYTVTGATNMAAPGVYTLTVTGKGSYTGSQTVNVRVLTFEKYDGTSLVTATLPQNNDNALIVSSTTTEMQWGWYVVSEDVTVADRISVSGDVRLVLCDGATLTAEKGISVTDGHSLTIYSQSGNTGTLVATVPDNKIDVYHAAIGGDRNDLKNTPVKAGTITIHGGVINATSCFMAAAIGKAYRGTAGDITIYGGKITATTTNHSLGEIGIGGRGATVHLGWCRSAADFIESVGFEGTVVFDKNFILEGTTTVATVENIAGQKMVPTTGTPCTVTFQSNGGSEVTAQTVISGHPFTEPGKPMKTSNKFAGWYTDEGCTSAYDFSAAINNSFTLYAKWTAVSAISYIDADGQTVTGFTDYTPMESDYTELPAGNYFVGENTTVSSRINVYGTVNLILGDGTTLTAVKGVHVAKNNTLNIFRQSQGTGALTASAEKYDAAIGANDDDRQVGFRQFGTIRIYGGVVTATSGMSDIAAIGGSGAVDGGTVYILGGQITATGGSRLATIGGYDATIHLSWSQASDYILCDRYEGTIIFDKSFVLDSNDAIEANASNCGGQKLVPNTASFYDVSFDTNGGNAIASQHIRSGRQVTQPANPAKQHHTFGGWYADANLSGDAYDFTTAVTGNFTLYAKWRPMYAVSFDKNASDATGAMGAQTLYVGEPENLAVCSFRRTGYTFAGWATTADGDVAYADGASVTSLATTAGASVTLYAQWVAIPYTITAPANFEVTVGGNAATTTTIGQTVTLTVASGYTIVETPTVTSDNGTTCAVSDAGDGSYTFTMPAGNVTVLALIMENGWKFIGTYVTQNFTASDTDIYGFVGTEDTGTEVGTFVRVGGYVRVKPLRAYLQAPDQGQQAPAHQLARAASEDAPATLRVRLLGTGGETTSLSEELRVKSEEFATATEWYTLDGRKLSGEPTQKGLYIHNGKKVVIK